MKLSNNIVLKTKSGLFVRFDNDVGMFVFSPYTGLIYGVHKSDAEKIYCWLNGEIEIDDETYINTLGIGFKKSIDSAEFGKHRLLPEPTQWANIVLSPQPLVINWLITGKCSHKCAYCYASDMMGENTNEPNRKDIDAIINNILSYNPLVVVLTGGEPLGSPFLNTIIELLAGKVGIIIDTNGYLYTQEHINIFKEKNVVVRISIDSQRPQINDKLRTLKDNKNKKQFGVVKANELLNNCLDNGIATIVHTVATKNNINDLSAMGEKFVCMGVKVWRILRLSYANEKPDIQNDLGCKDKQYLHFYKTITEKSQRDWYNKMQVVIQQNLERERNGVILVSPNGKFMTESPVYGGGKILIDPDYISNPRIEIMSQRIDRWAHYNRYLNFE